MNEKCDVDFNVTLYSTTFGLLNLTAKGCGILVGTSRQELISLLVNSTGRVCTEQVPVFQVTTYT